MEFAYCPQCGEKLGTKLCGDDGEVPFCQSCGRPFFPFCYTCVICLCTAPDGDIALIKQGYVSDRHVTVAGYIKPGETAEQAAAREVREELGLEVTSARYIESYYHEKSGNLMLGYLCTVEKGGFNLSSEVDSAGWYSPEQARSLLGGSSVALRMLEKAALKRIKN